MPYGDPSVPAVAVTVSVAVSIAVMTLYEPLGTAVWRELQRGFLLQLCLRNPACFPEDAGCVMTDLAEHRRNEALFFDGVQRLDYLYYAYECYVERGITRILKEVVEKQIKNLDTIAAELPGFEEVVWTLRLRDYFQGFVDRHPAHKAVR